jgi:hypothetical protein
LATLAASERLAINLDHIGWWVDDLAATSADFLRHGFTVTGSASLLTGGKGDPPQDEGQRSSHIMFQNTYLELTSVVGEVVPAHLLQYQQGSGLKIIALGCVDAGVQHGALAELGWDLVEPARSERSLSYGTGSAEPVRFRWFMAKPTQFPEVLVCVVQHLDRGRLFDASMTHHANEATDLVEVLMLTIDPATSLARYRPLEASGDEATGWLTFVTPDAALSAFPGAALPILNGANDCVPMGIVVTTDRAQTGEVWFPGPGNTVVVVRGLSEDF